MPFPSVGLPGTLTYVSTDDEHLAEYLAEVRQLPMSTVSDERSELVRAREGGDEARTRVMQSHLELAALLALRLAPDWMSPLDAIQEANIVLAHLVDDGSVARPAARLTDALVAQFAEVSRRLGWDR